MQSSVYAQDSKRKRSVELSFTEHESSSYRRITSSSTLSDNYNPSLEMATNDKQGLPIPSLGVILPWPLTYTGLVSYSPDPMSNVTIVGPKGEIKNFCKF